MKQNLKTILYLALFTLNMWVGDQVVDGARGLEKEAVRAAASAYVNYRYPAAKIPENFYR